MRLAEEGVVPRRLLRTTTGRTSATTTRGVRSSRGAPRRGRRARRPRPTSRRLRPRRRRRPRTRRHRQTTRATPSDERLFGFSEYRRGNEDERAPAARSISSASREGILLSMLLN
eukprot:31181-Pelagococcus_subviridis.AAC.8